MTSVPSRTDIPVEHTWDTSSVFPSDAAWEEAIAQVTAQLPELARFQGRLSSSPSILAEFLDRRDQVTNTANKIYLYASMQHNVDTADQDATAKFDRGNAITTRLAATLGFAEPEMLAIGFDTLSRWMREEPRLTSYEHYFDALWQRQAHVRSAEVEELLGQLLDPFRSGAAIHGALTDADMRFTPAQTAGGEPVEIAQGNIAALLTDPDRETRRTAWENYADEHLVNKNTLAACMATGVKQRVFMARARRYGSALEAALSSTYIPEAVFHNLLDTFRRNLPTWHRYWRIRRQALGYDTLHSYDVKAPLTAHKPHVPFEQSIAWISEGMRPLGDEYVDTMRRGMVEERWVDIYPNQGKRAGAYSSGVQGTRPFILMSYNDDLFSMSTLAHELGHSMHSYYSWQTQPHIYSRYTIFVAEVASNLNQALVRAHLLEHNSDADFQIALIEEAMSNFHRYFFIMPTLARFELEIHQRVERGQALTADSMIALMTELFAEGYGDEVAIDHDRIGITWAQFPIHMYSNFYVYQYATGISAAHALAERILQGNSAAVDNYLTFLKTGSARYPLDALKLAGVDMTSPAAVEQTFGVLAGFVDRLEGLISQRTATV
jgi:oligoendopeptidase F